MSQGEARGQNLGHLQSAILISELSRYLTSLESVQIWTIGSIHGWLQTLVQAPGWG